MFQCEICDAYFARKDSLDRHRKKVNQCIKKSSINPNYAWRNEEIDKNHAINLPRDIRALIVGKSGYGKTTVLLNLLLEPGILDYDNLIVCGNSLHQPEYKTMNTMFTNGFSKSQVSDVFNNQELVKEEYGGVDELVKNYVGKGGITAQFLDNVQDIPDPSELDPKKKNLLILDDIMLGPQNKAEAYYTRGRHNNVDTIYIAQNYFRLPRHTVRENANLFILFKQDGKNLNHIHQDNCTDVPFGDFSKICNDVWNADKHNFVTIDTTGSSVKYRRNLDGINSNDNIDLFH